MWISLLSSLSFFIDLLFFPSVLNCPTICHNVVYFHPLSWEVDGSFQSGYPNPSVLKSFLVLYPCWLLYVHFLFISLFLQLLLFIWLIFWMNFLSISFAFIYLFLFFSLYLQEYFLNYVLQLFYGVILSFLKNYQEFSSDHCLLITSFLISYSNILSPVSEEIDDLFEIFILA